MADPEKPPQGPKRPPSGTNIQRATVDHVTELAVGPRRDSVPRKQTFTGLGAVRSPFGSGEYSPTLRAPSTTAKTIPTPASGLAAADAATGRPDSSTPVPPSAADGQAAALLAERDRLQAKVAELERDARAYSESKLETYPPKVVQRHPSPPPSSSAPRGQQGETGARGAPASKLSQLPAILLGAAGLVTALGTALKPDTSKQEAAYRATEAAYTALRAEAVIQNEANAKTRRDLDELRSWLGGYLKATGVKVAEPPGVEPVDPLRLAPAPITNRVSPSSAPAIQVQDPMPSPAASVAPVRLPKTLEALPAKP